MTDLVIGGPGSTSGVHGLRELEDPLRTAVTPRGTRRAVNLVNPDGRRLSIYDGRDVPRHGSHADHPGGRRRRARARR